MRTTILALPGDEDSVLDFLIREAERHERQFTQQELMAYDYGRRCAGIRQRRAIQGGVWYCTPASPCAFCEWTSAL